MVIEYAPLEDDLGDVLEKAMHHQRLTAQLLAEKSGVPLEKIRDAVDYRGEFSAEEVRRLAQVLSLSEVGLLALAEGRYPLPEIAGLPFCLYPLRMPHGIGVANAYLIAECGSSSGLLFDGGGDYAQVRRLWPKCVRRVDAIFVTHAEHEHIGGLPELRKDHPSTPVFVPEENASLAGSSMIGEGVRLTYGRFEVRVFRTPGHTKAHNCYLVSVPLLPGAPGILISGDLVFAGSVGGAYHCRQQLGESLKRLVSEFPENTVLAPGHGPLTTIKNERRFNPFVF